MAVSGGTNHSLVLRADGTLRAWGSNYYGQLGDGVSPMHHTPAQVLLPGAGSHGGLAAP